MALVICYLVCVFFFSCFFSSFETSSLRRWSCRLVDFLVCISVCVCVLGVWGFDLGSSGTLGFWMSGCWALDVGCWMLGEIDNHACLGMCMFGTGESEVEDRFGFEVQDSRVRV